MEAILKLPEPLIFGTDIVVNWKKFEQKFRLYIEAIGSAKINAQKVAILLNCIGDDGLDLYNTFTFEKADDKKDLEIVLKKFTDHFEPRKNVIIERFKFNNIVQKEDQNVDQFVTELKKSVKQCEYKEEDEMVRDRIVIGLADKSLQEKLLRERKLDLNSAINICQVAESSKCQSKVLHKKLEDNCVYALKAKKDTERPVLSKSNCLYCDLVHEKGKCPAWGKTCAKCQGRNHYARVCKNKNYYKTKIHEVKEDECESTSSVMLNSLKVVHELKREIPERIVTCWEKELEVEGKNISFKLDTGAELSVLPFELLKRIKKNFELRPTRIRLVAYGSDEFRLIAKGMITLTCNCRDGLKKDIEFVVVDVKSQMPLLGLAACIDLALIARIDMVSDIKLPNGILEKYAIVFEGLGCFPTTYKIEVDDRITPKISPIRRVAYSLTEKLKRKLDDLEKQGIIRKVEKPTEWVSSLVIVEKKNGDLRLCLNPKYLNEAIKREHYLIPNIDDIMYQLNNKKWFTVLDMKDGYWQVPIDAKSSDLCTFGTQFGRYQFRRLPFGISSAPEIFHRKNVEVFGSIPGVAVYFDDIVVTGETEEEHDANLSCVLEKAVQYNIKFNKSKIQYKSNFVKFVGQIFSKDGVTPDKSYTEAIVDMKSPVNKTELMRILGMAKYLCRFIPNMSKLTAPLRELTKNDIHWQWLDEHESSLRNLKQAIVSAPVLAYFDFTQSIVIQTDASKDGMGCCISQNNHPVAFASRSLTPTEQKYAQIEKEMLAIVFAVEKFSTFIYGHKDVVIWSDHKPLETIFKRDLQSIPVRLQRMMMKIWKYSVKVKYVPGRELYIADTLSRAYLTGNAGIVEPEFDFTVHALVCRLVGTEDRKIKLQEGTKTDPILLKVMEMCTSEWPKDNKSLVDDLKHYWKLRNEIFLFDGLLFLNDKIIIPKSLINNTLMQLHGGHFGVDKTKARARQLVYWPKLNQQIESYVKSCRVCEKFANKQVKEELMPYALPGRPWERVGADIFTIGTQSYLVIYDAYSNWLELITIANKSAEEIISKFKMVFARFGCPDVVSCDNVPFNSFKMNQFAREWNFEIISRSPNYPRSNGLAEKAVDLSKKMIKKSTESGVEMYKILMEYRNTPVKQMGLSPAELMMGRLCKTLLPVTDKVLQPKQIDNEEIIKKLANSREKNEKYYNKTAGKVKEELQEGQNVTVYDHQKKEWQPGVVVRKHESPRSYIIRNRQNNLVRRNRVDLKRSENAPEFGDYDFEIPKECNNENVGKPMELVEQIAPETPVDHDQPVVEVIRTRSGREIRIPKRFDGFEM